MRDFLISLTVLGAGGYGLWLMLRNGGTKKVKDEVDPEAPRFIERRRAASEAAAAADVVLSEAEVAEVAELHEYFQEIGTGEQFLVLAFDADPLSAPIPDDRAQAEPALFEDVWKERLSLFTWSPPTSAVPLVSVQVPEPESFELESFTRGWKRSDIERMVAEAKAGASR